MTGADLDRVAELIERLLMDGMFRAGFRLDPVAACRAFDLEELADEIDAMGRALYTLELRESRSSLAGVVLAAAAEGVGVAGFARYRDGLDGEADAAAGRALSRPLLQAVQAPAAAEPEPAEGDRGQAGADVAVQLDGALGAAAALTDGDRPSGATGALVESTSGTRPALTVSLDAAERVSPAAPKDVVATVPTDGSAELGERTPAAGQAAAAAVTTDLPAPAESPAAPAADPAGLTANPNLDATDGAVAALEVGSVDPRANAVLTRLLATHQLAIDVAPGVDGVSPIVVITKVDGEAVAPNAIAPRDIVGQLATLPAEERPARIVTPWRIDAAGFAWDPDVADRIVLDFVPPDDMEDATADAPADSTVPAEPEPPTQADPEAKPPPPDAAAPAEPAADGPPDAADAADVAPTPAGSRGVPIGAGAVAIAKRWLGTPYSWGGGTDDGPGRGFAQGANTVGFDCSSLMKYAYAQLGVSIPRVTYDQVNAGVEVPRESLQPGDLILFSRDGDVHHVGMYIGNNQMIHAPSTGDVIKISSLDEPHYAREYFTARRVATGVIPDGVLSAAEVQDATAIADGAEDAAPLASGGALPAPGGSAAPASPAEVPPPPDAAPTAPESQPPALDPAVAGAAPEDSGQTGVFAAVPPMEQPVAAATVSFLPAVEEAPPAPPGAAPPLDPAALGPNPYPGDGAGKQALAQWLAREAQKAGLPPELPVMASLVESGVANLNFGDRDSVGFFQMRTGIWNQGAYAGYPERPELQVKWFIDQALAVKAKRIAEGNTAFETDPAQWGEWIADIERPAEQYRGRYQERLDEARGLLGSLPPAPATAAPGAGDVVDAAAPAPQVAAGGGPVLPVAPGDMANTNAGGKLHGSEFGIVDAEGAPRADGTKIHAGYDLFGKPNAPVRAMVAGTVVEVRQSRGNTGQIFGGTVKIEAADGRVYVYRHIDPAPGLTEGQTVQAGQQVAGITDWQGGPAHVHMELWKTFGGGYNADNMLDPLDELERALSSPTTAPPADPAGPPQPDPARAQPVADAAPTPSGAALKPTMGAAAVEIAKRWLGTPYSWGGGTDDGPSRGFDQGANIVGFDCSSLMKYAYAQLGVAIPRVTYDQVNAGVHVPRDQLQPGDLVLFARGSPPDVYHVGMYIGDNQFLHAPRTGDVVKISRLDDPYYTERFHEARRMATGPVPDGILDAAETQDALALGGGAAPAAQAPAAVPVAAAPAQPVVDGASPVAEGAQPPEEYGGWQSGVFAALPSRADPAAPRATVQFLPAVPEPAPVPQPLDPAVAPAAEPPGSSPDAAPPADAPAVVAPAADPANPYPGDGAGKQALAQWLAREAQKAGLPPELPVMASLVESGVANLNFGDRDSVGFFQMRTGIWNQGAYAGYPERPELQVKWFIDQALAVKAKRIAEGNTAFETDPAQWGEWIADIERPAEQYRGRYQERLDEARGLLGGNAAS